MAYVYTVEFRRVPTRSTDVSEPRLRKHILADDRYEAVPARAPARCALQDPCIGCRHASTVFKVVRRPS